MAPREDLGRDAVLSVLLIAGIAFFVGFDLIEDYFAGLTAGHFVVHVIMLALAVVHGAILWKRLRAKRLELQLRDRDLVVAQRETERWRREAGDAIASMGRAIQHQLGHWRLTEAESEVALLLLAGLSHKEIANRRGTSETTVRQQAQSLYRKSGLAGRNELAAFFLGDLVSAARAPGRPAEASNGGSAAMVSVG
jgi:DNA-binding CsgD family transcriptional regulator